MTRSITYWFAVAYLIAPASPSHTVALWLDQIWTYDEPVTQAVGALDAVNGDRQAAASIDEMYDKLVSRREEQIAHVHAYAAAGRFPRNTDFPCQRVPYFVDREGTACAVGHLMRLDGCGKVVARIAACSNHIRIADVHRGPIVNWIRDSGLTQAECALIQPSYATIEDYRRRSPWRDEKERLREHFAGVERALQQESHQSLGEALLAKVEAEIVHQPLGPAFGEGALAEALRSSEPNVRIAAAYAISRLDQNKRADGLERRKVPPARTAEETMPLHRDVRLSALERNLDDCDPAVRFWTAVAAEKIGSASERGATELHHRTLPVFLDTFRGNQRTLRLAALNQLANIAPECIDTSRQLRILPDIRQALVQACHNEIPEIRDFAREVLSTWRWQRTAYESQRMRRHYLAESFELESLAAEALAMDREFAIQPPSVQKLLQHRLLRDVRESITYLLPIGGTIPVPIADTETQAAQLIEDYHRTVYADALRSDNPPSWRIEAVEADTNGLYFAATVWRTDRSSGPKLIYLVPRPSMLSEASLAGGSWFKTVHQEEQYAWPASPSSVIQPHPDVRVVLGDDARDDIELFTQTCDVFVYFMAHHSLVVIDREVLESAESLTWSGRFASLRQYGPRFVELGGGGWDFHRLTMSCDRTTGAVTLSAEPIKLEATQAAAEILSPAWMTEELKLMGWKPLDSIDFFGDRLLPPEYNDVVKHFTSDNAAVARDSLYRRWHIEKSLPQPSLVLGLLYDRADRREEALKCMKRAVADGSKEPGTLADVARWEQKIGLHEPARMHAVAALELWPDHPVATDVLKNLEAATAAVSRD